MQRGVLLELVRAQRESHLTPDEAGQLVYVVRRSMLDQEAAKLQGAMPGFDTGAVRSSAWRERDALTRGVLSNFKGTRFVLRAVEKGETKLEGLGNVLAAEANAGELDAAQKSIAIIEVLAESRGPLADFLDYQAKRVKERVDATGVSRRRAVAPYVTQAVGYLRPFLETYLDDNGESLRKDLEAKGFTVAPQEAFTAAPAPGGLEAAQPAPRPLRAVSGPSQAVPTVPPVPDMEVAAPASIPPEDGMALFASPMTEEQSRRAGSGLETDPETGEVLTPAARWETDANRPVADEEDIIESTTGDGSDSIASFTLPVPEDQPPAPVVLAGEQTVLGDDFATNAQTAMVMPSFDKGARGEPLAVVPTAPDQDQGHFIPGVAGDALADSIEDPTPSVGVEPGEETPPEPKTTWQEARRARNQRALSWLLEQYEAGNTVYVSTAYKHTRLTPKAWKRFLDNNTPPFRVNSNGDLVMASGKSWEVIDLFSTVKLTAQDEGPQSRPKRASRRPTIPEDAKVPVATGVPTGRPLVTAGDVVTKPDPTPDQSEPKPQGADPDSRPSQGQVGTPPQVLGCPVTPFDPGGNPALRPSSQENLTVLTLVTLLVITAALEVFAQAQGPSGTLKVSIPVLCAVAMPWAAWFDLSGRADSGARTPFLAAVVFSLAAPLYFGLLPHNLVAIIGLGAGAPGPVRFAAEFGIMVFAPLALMVAPAVRLFVAGRPRMSVRGAPAGWLYQALAVLMVGFLSLVYVAASGIGGIETAAASVSGVWGDSARALVPLWFTGMLLAVFALAWGQVGPELDGE